MNKKDLGFNKTNIVILKINSQLKDHLDIFKEKLPNYPAIKNVSYSSRIPETIGDHGVVSKLRVKRINILITMSMRII